MAKMTDHLIECIRQMQSERWIVEEEWEEGIGPTGFSLSNEGYLKSQVS